MYKSKPQLSLISMCGFIECKGFTNSESEYENWDPIKAFYEPKEVAKS